LRLGCMNITECLPMKIVTIFPVIIACLFGYSALGQESSSKQKCTYVYDTTAKRDIYIYVDEMPQYPGGNSALLAFFANNYKYKYTGDENFQGSLRLEFIIDERGQLICPRIESKPLKDVMPSETEALRVLSIMPRWKPGSCNGHIVPVKVYLPITF